MAGYGGSSIGMTHVAVGESNLLPKHWMHRMLSNICQFMLGLVFESVLVFSARF